ncbi:MAG: lysophospholipid acyltransferase family protein [Pseudomonadales bacterium]
MATLARQINYGWRLVATALAFAVFGLGGVIIPLFALPLLLLLPGDDQRRQQRARYLVHQVFLLFIHFMRVVGILEWRFTGLEKLDRRGLLVLANHPTLLDVVFLVGLMPNANCIVKGQVHRNPVMRGLVSLTGYIVNEHGESLLEDARKSLDSGSSLIVFPEGTRTPPSGAMVFRRGAAHIALRARVQPSLAIIRCQPPTLSKQHKWYHIPDRRFLISIDVRDDLPIDDYLKLNPALGARHLTRDLQDFYIGELNTWDSHHSKPN